MSTTNADEQTTQPLGVSQEGTPTHVQPKSSSSGAVSGTLDLDIFQLSDVGCVRTRNEDSVDYHIPKDPQQRQQKGMLFLVADGMGGHQAGDVASRQAVQFVVGQYYGDTQHDIGTSLDRAYRAANRLINELAEADETKAGMGTTLVGAVVLGQKVYVANVGDSRAYIIGQAGTIQITEDHSWVEEQVRAGLLTAEQARVHPQRNLVTRALGSKASVEVDLFEGLMDQGDTLLLCTDGLTNYVSDAEIESIVRQNSAQDAGQRLVDLAKERGGRDNITVMIVSAQRVSPEAPARAAKAKGPMRILPILISAVLFLGVVAAGVVFLPGILGEKTEGPTPTVLASAPVAVTVPPTESPSAVPTETESPPEPSVTPTVEEIPASPEPSATHTDTPVPATATLAPTLTPTATETPTPTPTLTNTPSPTSTPTPTATPLPLPELLAPPAGDELHGEVEFEWSYPGGLQPGQTFQVVIWLEGAVGEPAGAAGFVREPGPDRFKQKIDLDAIPNTAPGEDRYRWAVVVVDIETEERKTLAGDGRLFIYPGRPEEATLPPPS